jgi:hypothetical protein
MQNGAGRRLQAGQDRQSKHVRIGISQQNCQDMTATTGPSGRTGKAKVGLAIGHAERDRQKRTGRT